MTRDDDWALARELADTVATTLGSIDGQRLTHHKGVLLAGTFTATSRAGELSRAPHLQGDPVRVSVRFSNGFPSPGDLDTTEGDPRGMAVKFHLADGSTTDLVCQDWPVFPAATPEQFRDLLRAEHAGEEAAERFVADHPDVAAASAVVETVSAPPASWATVVFNSLNAFRLVDADGNGRYVRWRLDPEEGERRLTADELAAADDDYLFAAVPDLLPMRHRLLAQLADESDDVTDPSTAWPDDREVVEMGELELTGVDASREVGDDVLVFDPMRLVDGIEPSDDPILRIRPYVYAESVRRRSGHEPPGHLR